MDKVDYSIFSLIQDFIERPIKGFFMRLLYITDLHGHRCKYEALWKVAEKYQPELIINGGDMLPKGSDNFEWQTEFIEDYLDGYFERFNSNEVYYLCYLGNNDVRILDPLFDR